MSETIAVIQSIKSIQGLMTYLFGLGLLAIAALTVFWSGLRIWYRIGRSLSKRKIAVFAEAEFESLKNILTDSGLFKKKNILKIGKNEIARAKSCSLYLVHYEPYKNQLDQILNQKNDTDALIVYSPIEEGKIDNEMLSKINQQRNTTTVNFRGRLLNDVFVSMITTGYKN